MNDIIIFGAGDQGKAAYECLRKEYNILGFCDNNKEKQNQMYCGLKIYSFEELEAMYRREDIAIVIASIYYYREIAKQIAGKFELAGIYEDEKGTIVSFDERYGARYYSQMGEDIFIWNTIMAQKEDRRKGFFIDVGAYHPVIYSNTFRAYKYGWNGINIEPNPEVKGLFSDYRKRDINISCAIADTDEDALEYYMFEEPAYNGFYSEEMLKEVGDEKVQLLQKIKVPICKLRDICAQYVGERHIDFMTIDVEGMELEVLKSNDWEKYRPKWLLVEEIDILNVKEKAVYHYLEKRGYELFGIIGITAIYKEKRKLDESYCKE